MQPDGFSDIRRDYGPADVERLQRVVGVGRSTSVAVGGVLDLAQSVDVAVHGKQLFDNLGLLVIELRRGRRAQSRHAHP